MTTNPDLRLRADGKFVAINTSAGWVLWRTDSPRVQAVRVTDAEVTGADWTPLVPSPVSPVAEDTGLRERIAEATYCAWQGSSPLAFAEQADDVREEYLRAADALVPVFEQAHGDLVVRAANLRSERDAARAAIADIDAHATPIGLLNPDDPDGSPLYYAVTTGSLHRALGKAYTAEKCDAERERLRSEVKRLRAEVARSAPAIPQDAEQRVMDATMAVYGTYGTPEEPPLLRYARAAIAALSAPAADPAPATCPECRCAGGVHKTWCTGIDGAAPATGDAPRVWSDRDGQLWGEIRDEVFVRLLDVNGNVPRHWNAEKLSRTQRVWGPLTEVAPSGQAPAQPTATPDHAEPVADLLAARDAVLNAPPKWMADNPGLLPPADLSGLAAREDAATPTVHDVKVNQMTHGPWVAACFTCPWYVTGKPSEEALVSAWAASHRANPGEDAATPKVAGHEVTVGPSAAPGRDVARCHTCAWRVAGKPHEVADLADQHRADTLRPSGPLAPIKTDTEEVDRG